MAQQQNKPQTQQDLNQLLKVRREKLAALQEAGNDPFEITKYDQTHHSDEVKELYTAHEEKLLAGRAKPDTEGMDEAEARKVINDDYNERRAIMDASPIQVSVAGRMMFKRVMGKASFCNIQDLKGKIQIYVSRDSIGEESYAVFKKSDIGDIYGIKGYAFRTKTGEISIHAEELTLLSKSLQILPEKFHGLTDTDVRYRQRYIDLIMNEDAKRVAIQRPRIIRAMQEYFDSHDFIEVETPVLQNIQGGATARPFITHHNALDADFYLRIATELHLKRLLVGGLERVYEIGRIFRNEGMDRTHNPEFTTVELYQAFGDLSSMMELCEGVIRHAATKVIGKTEFKNPFNPDGELINIEKPFRVVTMCDVIKEQTGVDFKNNNYTFEEALALAKEHNVPVEPHFISVGHIINAFFEEYGEKTLIQPTFLCGHPIEISPLTKKDPADPRFVQRFELFIGGKEFANAYTELNDPIDQKERFLEQLKEKDAGNDEANEMDTDFVEALEYGMPPAGGIGIGVDRLVIFLTESTTIRDVILFPQMKTR